MKKKIRWRAIITFANIEYISDDWNWFYNDIKETCKLKNIMIYYIGPGDDKKVIIGPIENPFKVLDISFYLELFKKGYLFLQEGKEIKYQEYNQSYIVLKNASDYFEISLIKDQKKIK